MGKYSLSSFLIIPRKIFYILFTLLLGACIVGVALGLRFQTSLFPGGNYMFWLIGTIAFVILFYRFHTELDFWTIARIPVPRSTSHADSVRWWEQYKGAYEKRKKELEHHVSESEAYANSYYPDPEAYDVPLRALSLNKMHLNWFNAVIERFDLLK
jgi:hypothetical protein